MKRRGKITKAVWYIIIPIFIIPFFVQANDTIPQLDTTFLGEQLFLGNNERLDSAYSCVECHSLLTIDTFSWNPTAYEIAATFADKEIADYEEVLVYAMSEKMFLSHEGAEYLEEIDFYALKAYLTKLQKEGPPVQKEVPVKRKVFIITFILFFVLFFSGIFFRKVRIPYFHRFSLFVILVFWILYFYNDLFAIGLQQNYEPDQSIKFSHKTHSTQNKTTCIYCHPSARYSASAGIPGVNVCMNCHSLVREGTQSGEIEIKKLVAASEQNYPLQWIRINNLPEHVQFNHAIHYEVGKIDCTECHGDVEQIDRLSQVQELSMKWCLDCHNLEKVNKIGNQFYQNYKSVSNGIHNTTTDSVLVKDMGGWDCMNCHY